VTRPATSTPTGVARPARCVMLLADGASYAQVCRTLGLTDRFTARWKQRYQHRSPGVLCTRSYQRVYGKLADTLYIAYRGRDSTPLAITKQIFVERRRVVVVADSLRAQLSQEFGPALHCNKGCRRQVLGILGNGTLAL
jgi:hypothetical protein